MWPRTSQYFMIKYVSAIQMLRLIRIPKNLIDAMSIKFYRNRSIICEHYINSEHKFLKIPVFPIVHYPATQPNITPNDETACVLLLATGRQQYRVCSDHSTVHRK